MKRRNIKVLNGLIICSMITFFLLIHPCAINTSGKECVKDGKFTIERGVVESPVKSTDCADFVNLKTTTKYKGKTTTRYAYQQLNKKQKRLYNVFLRASNDFQKNGRKSLSGRSGKYAFRIYFPKDSYSYKETKKVVDSFRADFSEFYWIYQQSYYTNPVNNKTNSVILYIRKGYASSAIRKKILLKMQKNMNFYKSGIRKNMTTAKREKLIHDRLCKKVKYQYGTSSSNSHTIVGALVENRGVCETYARTFSVILTHVGVPNNYIEGYVVKGSSVSLHAWNQVKVNKKWYNVDVTWNSGSRRNTYYNLLDHSFKKDHIITGIYKHNGFKSKKCNGQKVQ